MFGAETAMGTPERKVINKMIVTAATVLLLEDEDDNVDTYADVDGSPKRQFDRPNHNALTRGHNELTPSVCGTTFLTVDHSRRCGQRVKRGNELGPRPPCQCELHT
ncbi:hypothetical protein ACJQWK_07662 [Exserohilum turcicum]